MKQSRIANHTHVTVKRENTNAKYDCLRPLHHSSSSPSSFRALTRNQDGQPVCRRDDRTLLQLNQGESDRLKNCKGSRHNYPRTLRRQLLHTSKSTNGQWTRARTLVSRSYVHTAWRESDKSHCTPSPSISAGLTIQSKNRRKVATLRVGPPKRIGCSWAPHEVCV